MLGRCTRYAGESGHNNRRYKVSISLDSVSPQSGSEWDSVSPQSGSELDSDEMGSVFPAGR